MEFVKSLPEFFFHLFYPKRSNNHRPLVIQPIAYLILSLMVFALVGLLHLGPSIPGPGGMILGFSSSITATEVIEQTNQERAKSNLDPLTLNPQLTAAALAKAQHMMTHQYWAHVSQDGKEPWTFIREAGYQYRVAGENLARDFTNTPNMIRAWLASPTHRDNMLSPRYREIGVAVIDGVLEGQETTLVVQMFGLPLESAPASQVTPQAVSAAAPAPGTQPMPAFTPQPETLGQSNLEIDSAEAELADLQSAAESGQSGVVILDDSPSSPESTFLPDSFTEALSPIGRVEVPPLLSPLQLTKAIFLGLIMMLSATLAYDAFISENARTVRLVGKNLAHIIFLGVIAFLVIFFKGGIVG